VLLFDYWVEIHFCYSTINHQRVSTCRPYFSWAGDTVLFRPAAFVLLEEESMDRLGSAAPNVSGQALKVAAAEWSIGFGAWSSASGRGWAAAYVRAAAML
jgi:hypothetical protein